MSIVVDKIARPASYEGFPVCPTIHIPSDTYIHTINSMRKIFKKLPNWPKKTSIVSYTEIHPYIEKCFKQKLFKIKLQRGSLKIRNLPVPPNQNFNFLFQDPATSAHSMAIFLMAHTCSATTHLRCPMHVKRYKEAI